MSISMFHEHKYLLHGKHPFTLKALPGCWILIREFKGKKKVERITRQQAQLLLDNATPAP